MGNKCTFCNNISSHWGYYPMIFPQKEMEEKIERLGGNTWWKKLEDPKFSNDKELESLALYDQMLNTVGRSYCCKECDKKMWELFEEYYPQETSIHK